MKKILSIFVLVAIVLSCFFVFTACVDEEEAKLDYIKAEVNKNVKYYLNDKFDISTITVTAYLTDGTEKVVSADKLDIDKSDLELNENGRLTKLGDCIIKFAIYNDYTCELTITVE